MSIQDFLFVSLSLGFLILVGFISLAAFRAAQTLRSMKFLIDNLEDTSRDINSLKNNLKFGALGIASTVIRMFLKRR